MICAFTAMNIVDFHIGVAMKITAAVQSNLRLKVAYIMAFKAIPFKWI